MLASQKGAALTRLRPVPLSTDTVLKNYKVEGLKQPISYTLSFASGVSFLLHFKVCLFLCV